MITFKNIAGHKFLAVGTIKRKSALNGEKSLTGTLYDGDDVLNKIDKGWSLEFDNEPYIVTYFERNDNDNSVSFDAIHKFFWDMTKNVLYSETNGSHTIKWYLDQIFANTGYTYALNFDTSAIAKDNWGMKNKLFLFNDIINSIEGEFELNGTLVSIYKNIGTDLSTIVRYGFNLSDMTIENDSSKLVTYGEGFGAYADQESMTGDRLHVSYTSPLANVYGKLEAEPVDDQRYTIESNLLKAVQSQIDSSFSVSVNLSLYDLSVAGYPYKMANVGDWLTAVDENLDFKQRIRIISIDDEFDADGTRISYNVAAGDIGLTKKYQDANASLSARLTEVTESASRASTDANHALISANGKNTSYYINSVDDLPKTANDGDLAWVKSGDGTIMYIYTKKADGSYYWEKRIDPEMGEQIELGVEQAVADAKSQTDKAISDNNALINDTINTVSKQQADLAIKAGDFNNKAQAMADKALSDAKDNTATVAQQTASNAQSALDKAKTDLTAGINKEVSDRNSAVTALDAKAQGYATQAKTDALAGANTAIGKEIADRNSAISTLDSKSQNAINQAKTDAQGAIDALSIGGRNYFVSSTSVSGYIDAGTGGVHSTTQGDMMSDFIAVSPKDTWQLSGWAAPTLDGNVAYAFYDGNKIFLTGSKTVKIFDNVSSYATISMIIPNGTAYIRVSSQHVGNDQGAKVKIEKGTKPTDWTAAPEDIVQDYTNKDNEIKQTFTQYQQTNDGKVSKAQSDVTQALGLVATKVSQTDYNAKTDDLTTKFTQVKQTADTATTDIVAIKKTNTTQDSQINSVTSDVAGTKQSISDIKTTQDSQSSKINQITTDVSGTKQSITDIQTKDGQQDTRMGTIETGVSGVKSDFTTYQKSNDGAVKTAQTTAQTAVDGLKTKVSQTDYNAKTGQLQSDLNTTSDTANQSKQDIVAIKNTNSSQDSRMNSIESDAGGTKQTVSDIQKANGVQDSKIATITSDVSGLNAKWLQTQSDINNLGQINQLFNTEFSPDLSGWNQVDPGYEKSTDIPSYNGSNVIHITTASTGYDYMRQNVPVTPGQVLSFSTQMKFAPTTPDNSTVYWRFSIAFYKNSGGGAISTSFGTINYNTLDWTLQKLENITVPASTDYALVQYYLRGAGEAWFTQPMLVFDAEVGDYSQGNYNNNNKVATLSAGIDGLTGQFTQYQSTNDGKVSKAQTDIVTNAKAIINKVSQSDYDAKTGDLTSKVNTAQSTADTANTAIGSYKTSNDKRVSATETSIAQSANDITLRATTADLNSAKSDYNSQIAQVNIKADGINNTVSALDKNTTTKFTTQQQTIDGISTIVDSNTKDLNSVTKRVTTAEGTLTSTTNRVTGVETKQTTIAGQITQEISDRGTGDTNTLQSAKTFTQSSISGYDTGLQSQLTQTNSAFLATISSNNLIIDSSLINKDNQWGNTPRFGTANDKNFYYTAATQYQSTSSFGFNQQNNAGTYSFKSSQIISVNSFTGTTLNVSVDILAKNVGTTSNDYLIIYLTEYDSTGTALVHTSIAGTIGQTNNSWINYRKKITLNADTKTLCLFYQMRGNGNIYIARPYVGVLELIAGGYTAGANNNNQTILSLFKDNWSIGIADNIGKITSGIVGDTNSLSLINKNIVLDADNTTVTGDFWAKAGNFIKLSASNITVGILNGAQVKIINLDAANISSGTIRGINMEAADISMINENSKIHGDYDWTDSDEAIFPRSYKGSWTLGKRRLDFSGRVTPSNSTDGGAYDSYTFYGLDNIKMRRLFATGNINKALDINAGNAEIYLRNRNNTDQDVNDNISVLTPGDLQLRGNTSRIFLSTNKILDARNITNTTVLSSGDKDTDGSNAYVATYVLRAKRFLQPVGYDDGQYVWMYFNPNSDDSNYGLGLLQGDHIMSSTWAYNRTYSFSPNLFVSSNGYIGRTTSASKYKLAITRYDDLDKAEKLLNINPARWFDKAETEQYVSDMKEPNLNSEKAEVKPHYGLIAEDLEKAGLKEFISYNSNTGEIEGLEYDRVWTVLIPYIRNLNKRIDALERGATWNQ